MTPTVTPAAACARVTASGSFKQDGFWYDSACSQPYGSDDTICATDDATGAQWCVSGEPGTPITAADEWVLV